MWRSVPQIPVRRTLTTTSLIPGTGSGTVSRLRPGPAAFLTSASMGGSVAPWWQAGRRLPSGGRARILGPVDDRILHRADALDLDPDAVARLEEHRRVAEHAHAGGGPGGDDVARLEGQVPGDEAHQRRDVVDEVRGRAGLHPLRLVAAGGDPPAAELEAGGDVDLVRGHEVRADRQERVRALGAQP